MKRETITFQWCNYSDVVDSGHDGDLNGPVLHLIYNVLATLPLFLLLTFFEYWDGRKVWLARSPMRSALKNYQKFASPSRKYSRFHAHKVVWP